MNMGWNEDLGDEMKCSGSSTGPKYKNAARKSFQKIGRKSEGSLGRTRTWEA